MDLDRPAECTAVVCVRWRRIVESASLQQGLLIMIMMIITSNLATTTERIAMHSSQLFFLLFAEFLAQQRANIVLQSIWQTVSYIANHRHEMRINSLHDRRLRHW